MAKGPESATIRTYQVGFGDCFLLTLHYAQGKDRHVLFDFGSTGLPKGVPESRMMDIALDIEKRVKGQLDCVVATHRHRDHVSGFATKKGGNGTGDVIGRLKPRLVVQPWTEDPKLATKATGPKKIAAFTGARAHVAGLAAMETIASHALQQSKARYLAPALRQQLAFLGEDNIQNAAAVSNLMTMGKNVYVHAGMKSGLEAILPGVKVHVLGPPTVDQSAKVKKQRARDPNEFWQLQAGAMKYLDATRSANSGKHRALFPKHVLSRGPTFPVDARWLVYHARAMQGDQLLQIVRMLDTAMNNTSVILLLEIGKKLLLFPGDAQIENWEFSLGDKKVQKLLANVNLYKVGHHGSLNATPKSLWKLFKNRGKNGANAKRLISLMSTMEHKHGSESSHTEVPRKTLLSELDRDSNLIATHRFRAGKFFEDTTIDF